MPAVTALVRGLEVLRCFDYARKSLGSSEIARLTGLPQPTVWRLCKTLEQEGYLVAEAGGTRFAPGLAVLTLGYAALGRLDLAELARPRLQAIADRFHGASGMTTRDRLSILILGRCEGSDAYLNLNLRAGSEGPISTSASGWAGGAGACENEGPGAGRGRRPPAPPADGRHFRQYFFPGGPVREGPAAAAGDGGRAGRRLGGGGGPRREILCELGRRRSRRVR